MGIFDLFKRKNRIKNATTVLTSDDIPFVMGESYTSETNALKLSAVYAAISTIATTMSKIPFYIINRNTKERIEDDNLYNLLNLQPNSKINASAMHKLIWTWVLTRGEAFVLPLRGFRSTEVIERIPIDPDKVSVLQDAQKNIYYRVSYDDKTNIVYRSDEIEHIMAMTVDGIRGISPLEYAKNTVQVGLNQETFAKAFYENYGRPSDYLKTQTDLSLKKVERTITKSNGEKETVTISAKDAMREEWAKAHSGDNKFKTAILDNGLEYGTVTQITPEQMEFVNSKEINVQDIARFFDMSSCMFKLGVGSQTYSTNEQGQICYINETILGKLRQWEQELTLKLLTEEQRRRGWVIKGNIDAELRGDSTTRAAYYQTMIQNGVYTINDVLALEDKPSIGEDGDVHFIGPNYTPIQTLINGTTVAEATPNPISDPDGNSTGDNDDTANSEQGE